jgi:hypothetical protein
MVFGKLTGVPATRRLLIAADSRCLVKRNGPHSTDDHIADSTFPIRRLIGRVVSFVFLYRLDAARAQSVTVLHESPDIFRLMFHRHSLS